MCPFKNCPIFAKCEQEVEQVLYCRHIEMIKKIARMRSQLRNSGAKQVAGKKFGDQFQVPKRTVFDLPEDTKMS